MKVERFDAVGDLVGGRVRISWEVALAAGESFEPAPKVSLRRKRRDFEFPGATEGQADPFVVYDSAAFPPPGTTVTEIDLGETRVDGVRTVTVAESVSTQSGDLSVEVLRRTRAITYDDARRPLRRREEIVDVGGRAGGLDAGTTYYYELIARPPGGFEAVLQATATPTAAYGGARTMYELMPAIIRRHDVTKASPRVAGSIPEALGDGGQLRRFVDLFGTGLDHLRSRADGLRGLHDVDDVDHRMLAHLAAGLGWDLSHDKSIPLQRHEVKFAAQLYRITGTLPGCAIWVKRLSGWDVEIRELWRNVLFTNDLGNPDDPSIDPGSRTIDTADAALIAAIGTADDRVDYVTDTGSGPNTRYAMNVVGVFARPGPLDTAEDVINKRARILNGARLFLPFNLRAVVVVDVDTITTQTQTSLGLTATQDESR